MDEDLETIDGLLQLGRRLEERPQALGGWTVAMEHARRLLRVRDREGTEQPLYANPVQEAFEARRGRQNIVLKARQMGLTTWVAGRFFLRTITARGVLSVQVAHTREAAEGIFRMVQRFWECLPEPMRKGPLRRSLANVGQMRFPELDSEFRVLSAADEGAGRGLTMQNLHCSEVARWPGDAAATLAGLRAALSPKGELVLESTPNGAYGCFYDEWMRAGGAGPNGGGLDYSGPDRSGPDHSGPDHSGPDHSGPDGSGLVQHFFPWWLESAYVSSPVTEPTEEETALMQRENLTPEQIGFRRSLAASYRGLRSQEFAEDPQTCFKATGECCFDIEAIERRMPEVDKLHEARRGGSLQIWLPPVEAKEYLVAVDSAGGGPDGDFAVIQVIDLKTGCQCAELQQRLNVLELARVAAALGREYEGPQGEALIVVERNNHGAAVLAHLQTTERYTRLWPLEGEAGWLTTSANKPLMISRLGSLLVESPELFQSRRLLAECRTFLNHPGGRTAAANGAHDDCVMAIAIAQQVRAVCLTRKR